MVFPSVYAVCRGAVKPEERVYIRGKLSLKDDDRISVLADEILPADEKVRQLSRLAVRVRTDSADREKIDCLKKIAAEYPGSAQLQLYLSDLKRITSLKDAKTAALTGSLLSALIKLFGRKNVRLRERI